MEAFQGALLALRRELMGNLCASQNIYEVEERHIDDEKQSVYPECASTLFRGLRFRSNRVYGATCEPVNDGNEHRVIRYLIVRNQRLGSVFEYTAAMYN